MTLEAAGLASLKHDVQGLEVAMNLRLDGCHLEPQIWTPYPKRLWKARSRWWSDRFGFSSEGSREVPRKMKEGNAADEHSLY